MGKILTRHKKHSVSKYKQVFFKSKDKIAQDKNNQEIFSKTQILNYFNWDQ